VYSFRYGIFNAKKIRILGVWVEKQNSYLLAVDVVCSSGALRPLPDAWFYNSQNHDTKSPKNLYRQHENCCFFLSVHLPNVEIEIKGVLLVCVFICGKFKIALCSSDYIGSTDQKTPVTYPGILFGGVQQIQFMTEDRENGDLGTVAS
jgi:hypothetical protein